MMLFVLVWTSLNQSGCFIWHILWITVSCVTVCACTPTSFLVQEGEGYKQEKETTAFAVGYLWASCDAPGNCWLASDGDVGLLASSSALSIGFAGAAPWERWVLRCPSLTLDWQSSDPGGNVFICSKPLHWISPFIGKAGAGEERVQGPHRLGSTNTAETTQVWGTAVTLPHRWPGYDWEHSGRIESASESLSMKLRVLISWVEDGVQSRELFWRGYFQTEILRNVSFSEWSSFRYKFLRKCVVFSHLTLPNIDFSFW